MTSTYWVRFRSDTTVVEADDYSEAVEKAAIDTERDPEITVADDVEELREGDFQKLFTDVHVTVDSDGPWTGSLTVETNDDSEYQRETLFEMELVDELGLFGAYFSGEMHGTFEKNNVCVLVRGHEDDDGAGGSVYVVQKVGDL